MNTNNFSVETTTTNYYDVAQLNKVNELIEKNLMSYDCSVLQQLYLIEDEIITTQFYENKHNRAKFDKIISMIRNFQKFFTELQFLLEENKQ